MNKLLPKGFLILALLLAALCIPAAAGADTNATSGDGQETVCFYVDSYGNARVDFAQEVGLCSEFSFTHFIDGIQGDEDEWGMYHIYVTSPNGYTETYEWNDVFRSGSFSISIDSRGLYTVRVVPYTAGEINRVWSNDHFDYWTRQPQWWVSGCRNCGVTPTDPNERYPTGTVSVFCYDQNGGLFASYAVTVTGQDRIYPRQYSGYTTSDGYQYVTLDNRTGVCSPSSVSFRYRRNVPTSASVQVRCETESGASIRTCTETVSSSGYLYPPSISGYTAVSSGQYVTFDTSTGTASPSSVTFRYRQNAAPVTQPPASSMPTLPNGRWPVFLRSPGTDVIRPQCGPGSQYDTFRNKIQGQPAFQTGWIRGLQVCFVTNDYAYVQVFYNDSTQRYGFFPKSIFNSPDGSGWNGVPSYPLSYERRGTVTSQVTPYNGPGYSCGDYPSCALYGGDTVYACMESGGWYLCRFYNNHDNFYGYTYLWVPGSSIRWN